MSWRQLTGAAAVWAALAMIVVGIVLTDPEAIAIGVGLAVGAFLLRFRSGLLGRLLLLVLFADVALWMVPAAATNIANGEDLLAVAPPVVLAAVAIVGLVAVLVTLMTRSRADKGAARLLAPAAVLAVAAVVVSQLGLFGDPVEVRRGDVLLKMKAAEFARERIQATAPVSIVADNEDLFWHTVTIDELDVDVRIPVQARRRVVIDAPPGSYTYYCAIPGHESRMKGTLVIVET